VRALAAGATVGRDDLMLMRPGTGIPPLDLEKVIGRRSARNIAAGETLTWSDII
jgi:sialic acid synthase SpsE